MPATLNPTKEKIHEIIFEADTPQGKYFDIFLMIMILASVTVVMLESITELQVSYQRTFTILEWVFTAFFTIEYVLRLYCVYNPMKYARSFYGIIDLLSILPTYLSLVISGTHTLMVIRALRLFRVLRIFKLGHFLKEGHLIADALRASRAKITVFLVFILLVVMVMGSLMYLVESEQNSGFTSIPRSIYWAIVTLTTVGYGDIAPQTSFGQFIAAAIMIMGYVVIAVPTGIVSTELLNQAQIQHNTQCCRYCGEEGHDDDAVFCKYCGEKLNE
ncbi:MAG: ion transporter [Bacteroidota bacterium]